MRKEGAIQDYYGPGNWDSLHLMAATADDKKKEYAVKYLVGLFAKKFVCKKCRKHFSEYLKNNPLSKYKNRSDGLFYWTWLAHNNANKLSGKGEYSYKKAKKNYGVY